MTVYSVVHGNVQQQGGAGGAAPAGYTAEGINLPSSDWTYKASGLSNVSDGPDGTLSFWMNTTASGRGCMIVSKLAGDGGIEGVFAEIETNAGDELALRLRSTTTTLYQVEQGATNITDGNWHHVLVSWSLGSPAVVDVYVDDSVESFSIVDTSPTPGNVALASAAYWLIGNYRSTDLLDYVGDLAEMFLDDVYRDLSNVSNRRLFIDGSGTGAAPAGDLSSLNPVLYFQGPAADWATNLGDGGAFSTNGTISESSNEPVELA